MNIKFETLHIVNFMSFVDATVDFRNKGYVLVTGTNENPLDNATSNGSGKSSIFEAITYALTGETIRGSKNIVNLNADDGCYVELSFIIDKKHFTVLRSRDHSQYKTNLKIYIDGEDKSGKGIRDSEVLLKEYLPDINSSLLGSVIILGQGLPQRFTNNTPAGRKEVLEKLSKSDFMIDDLKERISKRKSDLSDKQRKFDDTILSINSKKQVYENQIEDNKARLSSLVDPEEHRVKIAELTSEIESATEEIERLTKSKEELEARVQDYRVEYSSITNEVNKKVFDIDEENKETFDNLNKQILSEQLTIDSLNKEITRLKSIKDVCPTCGQKLPGVMKPDTSEQEGKVSSLTESIIVLKKTLADHKHKVDVKKSELTDSIKVRQAEITSEANKLKTTIAEKATRLSELKTSIESKKLSRQSLQGLIDRYVATKESLEASIVSAQENIKKLDNELLYNKDERDNVSQHLDVINKFDTAVKRDFRGYLLQNVIAYIESRAKVYSKKIFDTDKIRFELDGNNISIGYLNKEYESLSGGEKQKVDLIVQFSIRDMLCKFLNFSSSILALDEIFDSLDPLGCQKVIDLISDINDIESIYIITHRKDLSIPVDGEINVVKNKDGVSELR